MGVFIPSSIKGLGLELLFRGGLLAVDADLGRGVVLHHGLPSMLLPLFRFVFNTTSWRVNVVLVLLRFRRLPRNILLIILPGLIQVELVVESMADTHVKELSLIHRLVHVLALLLGRDFGRVFLLRGGPLGLRGLRGFLGDLMRRRRFLDDVIVKVIVFRMTTTVNLLLLILRLVELELWGIFRPSQSVIRYRITVGSTELAIVGNLSRLYLLDLVCIDLINVCGITLDDLNQEGVPATFQLL